MADHIDMVNSLPTCWREYYEERAAIREHDGGQSRVEAERNALRETREAMLREEATR